MTDEKPKNENPDEKPKQAETPRRARSTRPEGYEEAFAALGPAGSVIAVGGDESETMGNAAAAGHPEPLLVKVLRKRHEK